MHQSRFSCLTILNLRNRREKAREEHCHPIGLMHSTYSSSSLDISRAVLGWPGCFSRCSAQDITREWERTPISRFRCWAGAWRIPIVWIPSMPFKCIGRLVTVNRRINSERQTRCHDCKVPLTKILLLFVLSTICWRFRLHAWSSHYKER